MNLIPLFSHLFLLKHLPRLEVVHVCQNQPLLPFYYTFLAFAFNHWGNWLDLISKWNSYFEVSAIDELPNCASTFVYGLYLQSFYFHEIYYLRLGSLIIASYPFIAKKSLVLSLEEPSPFARGRFELGFPLFSIFNFSK